MSSTADRRDGGERRRGLPHLLVGLLTAALFLPGLGSRDLWNPDEPRYAEVAREMTTTGVWVLPQLNGEIYSQKPPLQFWAIAGAGKLRGGIDEVAARLPAAWSAVVATIAVHALGGLLFGPTAAWMAAAAFATCSKVLWQGRVGQIDMLLTALVALAMLSWVWGWKRERVAGTWLFYLLCGLATLAKGPVGFLPPLLSLAAFHLVRRDRDGLRRLRLGRGVLLWAAVVLAWLVPAGFAGGASYLSQLVLKQNLERYANPWHHLEPFYYYFAVLPADFFPWLFLLPAALLAAWKLGDQPTRDSVRLCLSWVLVTLVFFSLSPAKRTVYVLTMYPALALLVGAGIAAIARLGGKPYRRMLAVPFLALGGLAAAAVLALPRVVAARAAELAALPADLPYRAQTLGAGLALALLAAGVFAWRRRPGAALGVTAAGMGAFGLGIVLAVLPSFDPLKSQRPLAAVLRQAVPTDERYGTFPHLEAGLLFYSRRYTDLLPDRAAVERFLAQGGRHVVVDRAALGELEGLALALHPAAVALPGENLLLVRTTPAAAAAAARAAARADGKIAP